MCIKLDGTLIDLNENDGKELDEVAGKSGLKTPTKELP